ncbi:MAG TPA: lamin tail domain-containing protein, partial [Verrucomicrobiae bacterium]
GIPGIYEIETSWESPEFTTINPNFTLPTEAMRVGRTYRARVKVKHSAGAWSHWSAPVEFTCSEPDNSAALQQYLQVTELMYNPPAGSDFEYIELFNSSTNVVLNLDGAAFVSGVDFVFAGGATLAPGEYALLVQAATNNNFATFRQHYALGTSAKIFGPYDGSLNNDGERLELRTAPAGAQIFSFSYNDGAGWPKMADGTGHSLEHTSGSYEYGRNWIGSATMRGSPLSAHTIIAPRLVLNEINAHTDYNSPAKPEYDSNDWIELINRGPSPQAVELSEYFLSDDPANLYKWRLPAQQLAYQQRISFDEVTGFHTPITNGFGLNKAGESVYLTHFPSNGVARVVDVLRFTGQENGFSVGRFPDGADEIYTLVPTRNGANQAVAPTLVIRELMYHPKLDTNQVDQRWQEFVEIQNVTGSAIQLWNTNASYRISGGISFTFTNVTIPANGTIVLASFDPNNSTQLAQFKQFYGVASSNITVTGPFTGQLANSSDRITLEKPDAPDLPGEPIVWVLVDEVIYTDLSGADGTSESLHRIANTRSGNDPTNFAASAPTVGYNASVSDGDDDDDGMLDDWERIYGLDPALAADAFMDNDDDGMTNLEEFRAGTSPISAASRFELDVFRAGVNASVNFDAVAGKTYSIQYCDDLGSGSWLKLRDVSGMTGAVTVNDPAPLLNERFYRLVTPSIP